MEATAIPIDNQGLIKVHGTYPTHNKNIYPVSDVIGYPPFSFFGL
ncbi:MAG: hypothetical protein ACTS73_06715 [Arsenophonus sp. NEOnobi-MAG3]